MADIDLKRLRAFVTTVQEGSITRAANKLLMQQPSLTRLLHGLELEFGTRLLHRLPRGVTATESGQVLLQEALQLLQHSENLQQAMRRATQGEQGRIAIGFTGSAALHHLVPQLLRRYRELMPQVMVHLEEASSGELLDALSQQQLDVVFVRSPPSDSAELRVSLLQQESMMVALPAGHALAVDSTQPLPLLALADEAFVLYRRPAGQGLYDSIIAACHAAGFSPLVIQEAPRLPATLSLVAAGLGVSIVPRSMSRLANSDLVYRPLSPGPGLQAALYMAMRATAPTPAVLYKFSRLVTEILAEQSADH